MKKKTRISTSWFFATVLLLVFNGQEAKSQLLVGATAPDWTLMDINGGTHHLYGLLNQGKTVVIDFMSVWCTPCWSYHTSHELKNFYNQYGPKGTNEAMVFMIEADGNTNTACLYGPVSGCNTNTEGNWVAGTPYPICDAPKGASDLLKSKYLLDYLPTIFLICPDKVVRLASDVDHGNQLTFTAAELATAMHSGCGVTSVPDRPLNNVISIYPNPSRGNLTIRTDVKDITLLHVKIYNTLGMILPDATRVVAGSEKIELDLSRLANGVYFVEVETNQGMIRKKINLNQ